jgi:hypothetical protein
MGVLTKRQKARLQWQLPDHSTTKEQQKYYDYCVQNNIRVSPIGIKDQPGKWYVGISTPDNYRKVYKSKHIYDREQIWDEMFNMCKYYYDKK